MTTVDLTIETLRRDRDAVALRLESHDKTCLRCLQFRTGFRSVRCSVGRDVATQHQRVDDALARKEME